MAADCPDFSALPSQAMREIDATEEREKRWRCRGSFIQYLRESGAQFSITSSTGTVSTQQLQDEIEKAGFAKQAEEKQKSEEKQKESQEQFASLGFGIGVGYSFGSGGARVEEANLVNDIVRVKTDNTDQARVLLEAHWFFQSEKRPNFGFGPFASINTGGTEDAIGSFALGVMIGFRDKDDDSKASWNLGVGYVIDSSVQVLGDGIVANEGLPDAEMEVRFKEESKGGLLVLFSRGF